MVGTRRISFLVALIAATAACSAGPTSSEGNAMPASGERPGGAWKVARVRAQSVDGPALYFADDGTVSGSTGCNRLATSATFDGRGGLVFAPTAITKMACLDGDRMAVESRFLDALAATRRVRHDTGRLQLLDGDEKVLIELEPAPERP